MARRAGPFVLSVAGLAAAGLLAVGCHDSDRDPVPTTGGGGTTNAAALGTVVFASGFEGSTQVTTTGQIQTDDIAGVDPSAGGPSDWGRDLDDRPEIGAFVIAYDGGNTGDRSARVIDDPSALTPANRVLQYRLASANVLDPTGLPLEGRIQGTLQDLVGVRDLYASRRLRLVSDVALLTSFAGAIGAPVPDGSDSGIVLFEAWNGPDGAAGPLPFRVVLDAVRPAGASAPLRLRARGQARDATTRRYTTVWSRDSAVSLSALAGRWLRLDTYVADGRAESGRFWVSLAPDGGAAETVFDVVATTVHPDDPALDGFADIEVLDLEAPRDLLTDLDARGQALELHVDDLVLYSGRRPAGVPAPLDPGSAPALGPPAQTPVPPGPPAPTGGTNPVPPGPPAPTGGTNPVPPGPPAPTGGTNPVPPGPPAPTG